MKNLISILCIVLLSLFIQSCDRYLITFNEQPVYEPPRLLTKISLEDPALSTCVNQTIKDKAISTREQLTFLKCTHAGITSIAGLEQFPQLKELDLSSNRLLNISALNSLFHLERVNLSGNPDLICADITSVTKRIVANIKVPDHCSL